MDQNQGHSSQDAVSSAHALLLPYPDQGHISPLMQLGIRLAAYGVQVTLAIPDHVHAKIVRAQLRSPSSQQRPLRNIDNFQIVGIKDGLPQDFDMREVKHAFDYTLEEGALDLVHSLALQGRPVTCIVGDFFLRWTWSLAERTSLPEFVFWPQCASVLSIYLNVDAIIAAGYHPFEGNVRAMVSREASGHVELEGNTIPGLPLPIHPADLPFEFPFEDGLPWLQKVLTDRLTRMGKSHGMICNTFEALEPEVFKALTLQFQSAKPHPLYNNCWPSSANLRLVGPLVPKAIFAGASCKGEAQVPGVSLRQEEVEECAQWLDSQPPSSVLFVAFGSMTPISISQVQELALGLAASGQRVLWVIREDAIRPDNMVGPPPKPMDATRPDNMVGPPPKPMDSVSVETVLPQGFLQQNRKMVRWAPQALVLSHPSVGGFFSHCGWNSTLESICCGVPLLGWPSMNDQVTNCWLATHFWKVGLTLERNQENQTTREHVERGVRQLMEGPVATSMRTRAKDLAHLARKTSTDINVLLSVVEDILRASTSLES